MGLPLFYAVPLLLKIRAAAAKNTCRCFACGAGGGPIDLVMRLLGKDFRQACEWLGGPQGTQITRNTQNTPSTQNPPAPPFDAARYERYFQHPFLGDEARRFLLQERRLDERVVRWCRLSSWKDKRGVPWLQIPYYDLDFKLIGIQNRNLVKGATPRFRFPQGSQCGIYNLPVLNLLCPGEELFITEGCSDCWAMLSAGHKAIAIPSATLLTKKDVELLSTLNSSPNGEAGRGLTFHMYPDNDAPGERLFLQLREVLPSLVHHQLPPGFKDFSELYLKKKRYESNV